MKLQQKISRIENGKNSLVEIRKITVRKLRFYKWLQKVLRREKWKK